MKSIEIVPAIIPNDFAELQDDIARVAKFVRTVQIDVVDGKFAPVTTWPYNDLSDRHWQKLVSQDAGLPYWEDLDFEVDLMVDDQIGAARDWISAGVCRVIGHIESFSGDDVQKFRALKDDFGVELVLALVPSTPNSILDTHLDYLDGVQFMGNDKIGYHGVSLDDRVYAKIRELRAKNSTIPIGIDIGVNFETAPTLVAAGATKLASGGLIFNSENPKDVIDTLLTTVSE